jgi:hypothetical protein
LITFPLYRVALRFFEKYTHLKTPYASSKNQHYIGKRGYLVLTKESKQFLKIEFIMKTK